MWGSWAGTSSKLLASTSVQTGPFLFPSLLQIVHKKGRFKSYCKYFNEKKCFFEFNPCNSTAFKTRILCPPPTQHWHTWGTSKSRPWLLIREITVQENRVVSLSLGLVLGQHNFGINNIFTQMLPTHCPRLRLECSKESEPHLLAPASQQRLQIQDRWIQFPQKQELQLSSNRVSLGKGKYVGFTPGSRSLFLLHSFPRTFGSGKGGGRDFICNSFHFASLPYSVHPANNR